MMNVRCDLRREIRRLLAACICVACQIGFNRKKEKTNVEFKSGRGVKAKRSKTNGHKTRTAFNQNGMVNITVTGCCLVTLSLVTEIPIYFTERRKIITGRLHSLILGNS